MNEHEKGKSLLWIIRRKRLLIGIGTIILIISMFILVDIVNLLLMLTYIGIFGIFLFVVMYNLSFLCRAFKLKLIFKGIDQNIKFSTCFFSLGACFFINDLTPGKLGDFTKIIFIKDQENVQISKSLCGVSIERILDILFLFFISFLALLYLYFYNAEISIDFNILGQSIRFYLLLGALLLFFMMVFVVILIYKTDIILNIIGKISSRLANNFSIFFKNFNEGLKNFKNHKRSFININLLDFPTYLIDAFITVIFFHLLGYELSLIILIFAIFLTYFSRIFPLTPGGWGVSENIGALFIFIFYPEIPYNEILSVFLIDHLIRSTYIFFFGGYSMVHYNIRLKRIKTIKEIQELIK